MCFTLEDTCAIFVDLARPKSPDQGFFAELPALPNTVGVDCPRCGAIVDCTLRTEEIPGERRGRVEYECRVPDLGIRLAEHYQESH